MSKIDQKYLDPTPIIDSDHQSIIDYATETIGETTDTIQRAIKLYYAVRDGIWYDPYYPFYLPEHYRASNVLKSGRGYCVCKAPSSVPLEGRAEYRRGSVSQMYAITLPPGNSSTSWATIFSYIMA